MDHEHGYILAQKDLLTVRAVSLCKDRVALNSIDYHQHNNQVLCRF